MTLGVRMMPATGTMSEDCHRLTERQHKLLASALAICRCRPSPAPCAARASRSRGRDEAVNSVRRWPGGLHWEVSASVPRQNWLNCRMIRGSVDYTETCLVTDDQRNPSHQGAFRELATITGVARRPLPAALSGSPSAWLCRGDTYGTSALASPITFRAGGRVPLPRCLGHVRLLHRIGRTSIRHGTSPQSERKRSASGGGSSHSTSCKHNLPDRLRARPSSDRNGIT
jgi:hypothetical protein